jgi:hypothetical protein
MPGKPIPASCCCNSSPKTRAPGLCSRTRSGWNSKPFPYPTPARPKAAGNSGTAPCPRKRPGQSHYEARRPNSRLRPLAVHFRLGRARISASKMSCAAANTKARVPKSAPRTSSPARSSTSAPASATPLFQKRPPQRMSSTGMGILSRLFIRASDAVPISITTTVSAWYLSGAIWRISRLRRRS